MDQFVWIVSAWNSKTRCFDNEFSAKRYRRNLKRRKQIKENRITVSIVAIVLEP